MATSLPQELLSLIASHITGKEEKLNPYTLVNKSWQAAFESDVDYVTVGPTEQHKKRGLSLSRLDDITSGPQDWRQARRTYIRHILYRVAVPCWLNEAREKTEDFTYDNTFRNENDLAFSQGVRSLFDYLSTWTDQTIALKIALQAENASVDEEDCEPETTAVCFDEGLVAPYCATLLPDYDLPRATCVISLDLQEDVFTPAKIPCEWSRLGYNPCFENNISVPAVLKMASACGALQKFKLDFAGHNHGNEPIRTREYRNAIADGLSSLPASVRSLEFCGNPPGSYEIPDSRFPDEGFRRQDRLCKSLCKTSTQLQHLQIECLEVFPELFCPTTPDRSIEAHWPYLETIVLQSIEDQCPLSAITRYADGHATDEALL